MHFKKPLRRAVMRRNNRSAPKPFDFRKAFSSKEETLKSLLLGDQAAGHPVAQGTGSEMHWADMLKTMLPARYQVSPAIVVDSEGRQSDEIDLIIRDAHFSPLLFNVGRDLYVPAESVYAVFEIKPTINGRNLDYASGKVTSVRKLTRTSAPFGWAQGSMHRQDLPTIIGGMLAQRSDYTPPFGAAFHRALDGQENDGLLDIGCVLSTGVFERSSETGAVGVFENGETSLVEFVLRLLRRLQALGSAPALDYGAYMRWVGDDAQPEDQNP